MTAAATSTDVNTPAFDIRRSLSSGAGLLLQAIHGQRRRHGGSSRHGHVGLGRGDHRCRRDRVHRRHDRIEVGRADDEDGVQLSIVEVERDHAAGQLDVVGSVGGPVLAVDRHAVGDRPRRLAWHRARKCTPRRRHIRRCPRCHWPALRRPRSRKRRRRSQDPGRRVPQGSRWLRRRRRWSTSRRRRARRSRRPSRWRPAAPSAGLLRRTSQSSTMSSAPRSTGAPSPVTPSTSTQRTAVEVTDRPSTRSIAIPLCLSSGSDTTAVHCTMDI